MELTNIVLASSNSGKIKEISSIFTDANIIAMREAGFTDEIEETGQTFRENAYIKARTVCQALGVPTLADDSGLCVDALSGAPGIFSARFSGKGAAENRKLLLQKMEGVVDRNAHFESAVCLFLPNGKYFFGDGCTYGKILMEEVGTNGFGYDMVFFSDELNKSLGVATDEEKNTISHRYRALIALKKELEKNQIQIF